MYKLECKQWAMLAPGERLESLAPIPLLGASPSPLRARAHAGPATAASTAALEQCLDALHTTAAVPESDLARLHDLQASLHCLAAQLPALMQVPIPVILKRRCVSVWIHPGMVHDPKQVGLRRFHNTH